MTAAFALHTPAPPELIVEEALEGQQMSVNRNQERVGGTIKLN
jgi:hypothetical protein